MNHQPRRLRDQRRQRGALHAHLRKSEVTEDQTVVQDDIHRHADKADQHRHMRFLYAAVGEREHRDQRPRQIRDHRDHQILQRGFDDRRIRNVKAHQLTAEENRSRHPDQRVDQAQDHAQTKRLFLTFQILLAEELRHEDSRAAGDAEAHRHHQIFNLGRGPDGGHLTNPGNHHTVGDPHRAVEQLLQGQRNGNQKYFFIEIFRCDPLFQRFSHGPAPDGTACF